MRFISKIQTFLWPIERSELKKFLPMSFMLLLTLFNYNALRSLKDSLIVPNVGAEAISLIKFFCVVPAAILFVIAYTKMTNIWNFRKIYIVIALVFSAFFILFGFILYPNEAILHPRPQYIERLISGSLELGPLTLNMIHFKWFFLVYGKWLFALFFLVAELWSVMNILLFWQFANQVITTNEAKRFFPMFAFMGSFGTFFAGTTIKFSSTFQHYIGQDTNFLVMTLMSILTITTILIIIFFEHLNRKVIKDQTYLDLIRTKKPETQMSFSESFKLVSSSTYLRHISILVIGYGITINLLEGPWKAAIREVYSNTEEYVCFMGNVYQWIGSCSMLFILLGVVIIKHYSWVVAAMITPITFFITGISFFAFVVFGKYFPSFILAEPLQMAVYIGMIQNILSKSTKYALFDPTKEMTYIPIDYQLKSKGKAAVDVIGTKIAKSGSSLFQTILFMIFPAATYLNISGILMVLFVVVTCMWIRSVVKLNKEYSKLI